MSEEDDDIKPSEPVVQTESEALYLSLIVPQNEVKNIKTALEAHDLFDKTLKISSAALGTPPVPSSRPVVAPPDCLECNGSRKAGCENDEATRLLSRGPAQLCSCGNEKWFSVPTLFEVDCTDAQPDHSEAIRARDIVLGRIDFFHKTCIGLSVSNRRRFDDNNKNPLVLAVRDWLDLLRDRGHALPVMPNILSDHCRWTYTIYPPMLLLPPNFLAKESWHQLLANPLQPCLPELWHNICQKLKVTHIAINKPIPALVPSTSGSPEGTMSQSNILRSPTDLKPIHGDFGRPDLFPSQDAFARAFWVRTVQNDISQVWAPMYTMFSRGNITEKTRLLRLLASVSASGTGGFWRKPSESTAVDLYAGIGYFAFSYAKAGVSKVLCWELNEWSIEGLRRGAKKNGWTAAVIEHEHEKETVRTAEQEITETMNETLLVFHESNRDAAKRVEALRDSIPPVRHVNCGYLPSSSDSWDVAVKVLDPVEGGWVHAHENVAAQDVDRRKSDIVGIFKSLVSHCQTASSDFYHFDVECQHVERVKAYAPGVMHCVFDIALLPPKASATIGSAIRSTVLTTPL
ncbi:MAG: hypothetical protein L6R40_005785 [Gallowayella cf. fulva]|nr:MAG: hypothetical protein L6R40_005785 [Xanthomendoza cf. fulva]